MLGTLLMNDGVALLVEESLGMSHQPSLAETAWDHELVQTGVSP